VLPAASQRLVFIQMLPTRWSFVCDPRALFRHLMRSIFIEVCLLVVCVYWEVHTGHGYVCCAARAVAVAGCSCCAVAVRCCTHVVSLACKCFDALRCLHCGGVVC